MIAMGKWLRTRQTAFIITNRSEKHFSLHEFTNTAKSYCWFIIWTVDTNIVPYDIIMYHVVVVARALSIISQMRNSIHEPSNVKVFITQTMLYNLYVVHTSVKRQRYFYFRSAVTTTAFQIGLIGLVQSGDIDRTSDYTA